MDTIDKIRSLGLYVEEKDGHYEAREFGDFVFNKVKKEYQKVSGRSEAGLKISGVGTLLWCNAVPSTESAYVEQQEAKALELYGEIKDGDRFDRSEMGFENPQTIDSLNETSRGWCYPKEDDQLYFGDLCLYNKGEWAKKIDSKVRARVTGVTPTWHNMTIKVALNQPRNIDVPEFTNHIEECVEAYFNGKND